MAPVEDVSFGVKMMFLDEQVLVVLGLSKQNQRTCVTNKCFSRMNIIDFDEYKLW